MNTNFNKLPQELTFEIISHLTNLQDWKNLSHTEKRLNEIIKRLSMIPKADAEKRGDVINFWEKKAHPFTLGLVKSKELTFLNFFNSHKKFNQVLKKLKEENNAFSETFEKNPREAFSCKEIGKKRKTVLWQFPPEIIATIKKVSQEQILQCSGRNLEPDDLGYLLTLKFSKSPKGILAQVFNSCKAEFVHAFIKHQITSHEFDYSIFSSNNTSFSPSRSVISAQKKIDYKEKYWKIATEGLDPACFLFIKSFLDVDIYELRKKDRAHWDEYELPRRFQSQAVHWKPILTHCDPHVSKNLIAEVIKARMNLYDLQTAINQLDAPKKSKLKKFLFDLKETSTLKNYIFDMQMCASEASARKPIFERCCPQLLAPFARKAQSFNHQNRGRRGMLIDRRVPASTSPSARRRYQPHTLAQFRPQAPQHHYQAQPFPTYAPYPLPPYPYPSDTLPQFHPQAPQHHYQAQPFPTYAPYPLPPYPYPSHTLPQFHQQAPPHEHHRYDSHQYNTPSPTEHNSENDTSVNCSEIRFVEKQSKGFAKKRKRSGNDGHAGSSQRQKRKKFFEKDKT